MHRFFIPPEWIDGSCVTLRGEVAHRISRVLRLSPGDEIMALDDSGCGYRVKLSSFEKDRIQGHVEAVEHGTGEPATKITLYQGLLKGSKFQWVLQKGTEVGISAFAPVVCARSVASSEDRWTMEKSRRWQKIIDEAAEQSGRSVLPRLADPVTFADACREATGASIIPWEEEPSRGIGTALGDSTPSQINLFIGPEGGFERGEIMTAQGCGIIPVTLGKRILRAETAGLVSATAIFYHLGEMGT